MKMSTSNGISETKKAPHTGAFIFPFKKGKIYVIKNCKLTLPMSKGGGLMKRLNAVAVSS